MILLIFRNSENVSLLLGRSISKENYISFNLDEFSNFKNLRITAYRNEKQSINCEENKITSVIQKEVNQLNKVINLNLVVIRLENTKKLNKELENYLINLNKKVLIYFDNKLTFGANFIYRLVKVDSKFLYYFNNDIQYSAKFILKRIMDILISIFVLLFISPLLLIISLLIFIKEALHL